MEKEQSIRQHVKALKEFYTNLVVYGVISIASVILWLSSGGVFWPIWVMVGFLIAALFQGVRLGVLPAVEHYFPFLKSDWEEQKIDALLNDKGEALVNSTKRGKSSSSIPSKE